MDERVLLMNGFKIFVALMAVVVILSAAPALVREEEAKPDVAAERPAASEPKLACKYYVDSDFKRSVLNVRPQETVDGQLLGGVVTHHLLADSMIAPFFLTLSAADPEIVFIVGPNHKRVGREKIHTGGWGWQTPFGVLEADAEAVESLIESCSAGESFDLLETEHSISSLVPYVKYYMPGAKLVPVLLHGNYGMEASIELARKIREAAGNRKWVVIGSIDFSHYLPPETAERMDEITLKAIEAENLEELSRMGNDNLDSPPSLMTLLSVMKDEGDYEMKVTGHSNSSEIAGLYSDSTTSYFTILFFRD